MGPMRSSNSVKPLLGALHEHIMKVLFVKGVSSSLYSLRKVYSQTFAVDLIHVTKIGWTTTGPNMSMYS